MGRPKPLLDTAGQPLLARIISALRAGGTGEVFVVTPPQMRSETPAIAKIVVEAGAIPITPDRQTPEMRATIELGLIAILSRIADAPGLLLCPCDTPNISASLVARILAEHAAQPHAVIAPTFNGKRGHPALLPAAVVAQIPNLPAGQGVKALFDRPGTQVVEFPWDQALDDVDTPEDYERWIARNTP